VCDVRRLFPTQEGLRDNIEWAMTIAASSSRLRLSHCIDTTSVDESTTAYDQAQAAIRTCKDFADVSASFAVYYFYSQTDIFLSTL
jgi:hypothetical protein